MINSIEMVRLGQFFHRWIKKKINKSIPHLSSFLLMMSLFSSVTNAQNKNIINGNQQWFHYTNQIKITNHWSIKSDVDYRWKNGFSDPSLYFLRLSGQFRLNSGMSFEGGYANIGYYRNDVVYKLEHRLYQEACVQQKAGIFYLSHRYRIEERVFDPLIDEGSQNPEFALRFRFRVQLGIPILQFNFNEKERSVTLNLGDEIMINAGPGVVNNIFDRNRLMVTPCLRWNEFFAISLTYNMEYAGTSNAEFLSSNDVLWLTIVHNIDIRKPQI